MTATELGWGTVVVVTVGIAALCFLAVILLVRAQRSHKLRIGFFIERDVPDPEAVPPEDWPTQH